MMHKWLLAFLFLPFTFFESYSQCDGNLGENIFTDGDFGSGSANVLLPDPQIAPGYLYQPNPPPNDGSYTITNNTTSWGSFASGWANIGDNSPDPNGYMMVVNASFEPGLFYEQEVDGLCENTLYVFSADVFNFHYQANIIRPNISFLLDGQVVYQTGDIPENLQWNTYGFTFTTDPGQTSITLALQNNAPGGGGNDLAIDNISFRACGPEALILPEEIANICEDGSPIDLEATIIGEQYDNPSFQWQESFNGGITWVDIPGATSATYTHTNLSAGYYFYRYLLANDPTNVLNSYCRVISNIKIVYVVPKFYTIIDTLCTGLSFDLDGQLYNETGIYTDSLTTFTGCDSIVTLDLTILPDPGIEATFNISPPSCPNTLDGMISIDNLENGNAPYTIFVNEMPIGPDGLLEDLAEGVYDYVITDVYGCSLDSSVILENPSQFIIDLGADWSVDLGEMIQIIPYLSEPADNFIWEPAGIIDCDPDCQIIEFLPLEDMRVSLTATSISTGCVVSDFLLIEVEDVRRVYIPNVFSPNFDGVNDIFTIFGAVPNVLQIDQLLVYNRWGSLVFENSNFLPNEIKEGWDGTIQGRKMQSGIYTYISKVRFLDNEVFIYKGDVLLNP